MWHSSLTMLWNESPLSESISSSVSRLRHRGKERGFRERPHSFGSLPTIPRVDCPERTDNGLDHAPGTAMVIARTTVIWSLAAPARRVHCDAHVQPSHWQRLGKNVLGNAADLR